MTRNHAHRLGVLFIGLFFFVPAAQGQPDPDALLIEAITTYESGNYRVAAQKISGLVNSVRRKSEPMARFYLGMSYYRQATAEDAQLSGANIPKLLELAAGQFEAGLKIDPAYGYNYAGKGLVQIQQENVDAAKENFQKAVELASSDVDLLITLASANTELYKKESLDKNKRNAAIDEAEKLLTRADAIEANNAKVLIGLGDVYAAKNVDALAKSNYENATKADPGNVKAFYRLGVQLIDMQQYTEGQQALISAKEIDPEYAPTYLALADLYQLASQYDAAKKELTAYRDLIKSQGGDKTYADARYGIALYSVGDYKGAAEVLANTLADTTDPVLQRLAAYSLAQTEQYSDAQGFLTKYFAAVTPQDQIALDYFYKGRIHEGLGQTEDAIQAYEKAITMEDGKDIEQMGVYKRMYEMLKAAKDYKRANAYLEKEYAISQNPTDLFYIGYNYYARLDDYETADKKLAELNELVPDFLEGYYYHALAEIAIERDDTSKTGFAAETIEKLEQVTQVQLDEGKIDAEKANKYNKIIWGYLASYYYSQNRDCDALRVVKKLKAIDEENAMVKSLFDPLTRMTAEAGGCPEEN